MSLFFMIIFALTANGIQAEKILELEENFDQQLVDDLLNAYREFGAAEIVLSNSGDEEKAECNKQKKLYADTLVKIFNEKGIPMSEYTGVKVKSEDQKLPIVHNDETNCKETITMEFYHLYIEDFVHDNLRKFGITENIEDLPEFQILKRNLEMIENHEIIQNALKSEHMQVAKEFVEATGQQVAKTTETLANLMLNAVDKFKSSSLIDITTDIKNKVQSAALKLQQASEKDF